MISNFLNCKTRMKNSSSTADVIVILKSDECESKSLITAKIYYLSVICLMKTVTLH